jgi:hypothetical protein
VQSFFAAFATVLLILNSLSARPAEDDPVGAKLASAKAMYEVEFKKFEKSVRDYFDGLESTARRDGNKKLVDSVKVERELFLTTGELPKKMPAAFLTKQVALKKSLTESYKTAIRDYTKAGKDELATKIERELQQQALKAKMEGGPDAETGRVSTGDYVQVDVKDQPMPDSILSITRLTPHMLELRSTEGWVGFAGWNPGNKQFTGHWEWQTYKNERSPGGKWSEFYRIDVYYKPDTKLVIVNGSSCTSTNNFSWSFRPK